MYIYAMFGGAVTLILAVMGWVFKINNKVTKHDVQIKGIDRALEKIDNLELEGKLAGIETDLKHIRAFLEGGARK